MKDKDTKLIWESYTTPVKEASYPGNESLGPPLSVLGKSNDDILKAKADPEKYMYDVEYPDNWDEDRLQREIDMEYQGGEMDGWEYTADEESDEDDLEDVNTINGYQVERELDTSNAADLMMTVMERGWRLEGYTKDKEPIDQDQLLIPMSAFRGDPEGYFPHDQLRYIIVQMSSDDTDIKAYTIEPIEDIPGLDKEIGASVDSDADELHKLNTGEV